MNDTSYPMIFVLVPLVVFGPLFLYLFYNFGLKEIFKIPEQNRQRREAEAETAKRFKVEHARKRGGNAQGGRRGPKKKYQSLLAQAVTYTWFAAVVGFLASAPPYTFSQPNQSLIKLSINHPGKRKVACQIRTKAELAKLAPNMRGAMACPRERWPVHVQMEIDGVVVYAQSADPAGLSNDGRSSFYRTFLVPAGVHDITVRMRDRGETGFDFDHVETVTLAASQNMVVGFDTGDKRLFFK